MTKNPKQIAVKVENLTKTFRIPTESSSGIKQKIINTLKGKKGYREFTPLKDISFEIEKGDFFGIVGRNGSGKSTLLKSIANIYTPNKGNVHVEGTLVPFIELGVGFNPELTGRENVFLNGALLGFSHAEMEVMYDDIVEFAEIGEFMDEKLKNYSSGMQVRLAFSIAIRAEGDILLLDEVLAVGDEAFQRKCYAYFARLKKENRTVILVTHDMDAVQRFCDKAMMIENGKIIEHGSVKKVAERYTKANADSIDHDAERKVDSTKSAESKFADVQITLKDKSGTLKDVFRNKPEDSILNIQANLVLKKDINKKTFCSVLIKNAKGEAIARFASEEIEDAAAILERPRKGDKIVINSEIQNIFGEGEYTIAVSFKSIDRTEVYLESEDKASFTIVGLGRGRNGFALRPDNKTVFKKVS